MMLVGTMGVCLSPCSLPGAGPMFQLGPRDMELGMGIYCTHFFTVPRVYFPVQRNIIRYQISFAH